MGLKNLIYEKTKVLPANMRLVICDNNRQEVVESSDQQEPLFLRDYPMLKNGTALLLLEQTTS